MRTNFKKCSVCECVKPITEFYAHGQYRCKECHRRMNRNYALLSKQKKRIKIVVSASNEEFEQMLKTRRRK